MLFSVCWVSLLSLLVTIGLFSLFCPLLLLEEDDQEKQFSRKTGEGSPVLFIRWPRSGNSSSCGGGHRGVIGLGLAGFPRDERGKNARHDVICSLKYEVCTYYVCTAREKMIIRELSPVFLQLALSRQSAQLISATATLRPSIAHRWSLLIVDSHADFVSVCSILCENNDAASFGQQANMTLILRTLMGVRGRATIEVKRKE